MAMASFAYSATLRLVTGVLCLFLAVVWGCTDTGWRGEVASVNGKPITLAQVTALRNSTYFDWSAPPTVEMEVARKQYGDALTTLIAVELVKQQLEKKKMSVSAEEVRAEENIIRADYPPGTFEDVLVSEAIDIDTWRFLLHNYLSVQRFFEKVLRNEVVITPEEASAYAKANPREFIRPPWAYFFLISGGDEKLVAVCAQELDQTGDPVKVQENNPEVVIRTARMDIPRLGPVFAKSISSLRPGDLSPVIAHNNEFHQILLLESLPEREAEANEIYLQAEAALVGQKLQAKYNEWVLGRLKKSSIKVSRKLLPHLDSPVKAPVAAGGAPVSARP